MPYKYSQLCRDCQEWTGWANGSYNLDLIQADPGVWYAIADLDWWEYPFVLLFLPIPRRRETHAVMWDETKQVFLCWPHALLPQSAVRGVGCHTSLDAWSSHLPTFISMGRWLMQRWRTVETFLAEASEVIDGRAVRTVRERRP